MRKLTLCVFSCLLVTALSVIKDEDVSATLMGKKIGEKCDGNDSDCLCAGAWVKCRCPWEWHINGSGQCTCEKGLLPTCEHKKDDCKNYALWSKYHNSKWEDYYFGNGPFPPEIKRSENELEDLVGEESERKYRCY